MSLKLFSKTISTPCRFLCINMKNHPNTMLKTKKKPFTIIVEGNIGSGKTTFLKNFESDENILTLPEPVEDWRNVKGYDLIQLLYNDIHKWSFVFQTYVQVSMMRNHELKTDKPVKIMERSLHSGRYVFIESLYHKKIFSPVEMAVLDEWFKLLNRKVEFSIDLIVYLRTFPENAYERIKERGRKGEELITFDYVKMLHEFHEKWLLHENNTCPAPVLILDANKNKDDIKEEYHNFQTHLESLMIKLVGILKRKLHI